MRRLITRAVPVLVTIGLLGLLWRQLPAGALSERARDVAPGWVLAGLAGYAAVNLLRAARFRLLLPSHAVPAAAMVPLVLAVSMLGNVLPARSNEVSFVVLARTHAAVPVAEGTAAITVARLVDLVAIAAWFVPLAAVAWPGLPHRTDWPVAGTPTAAWLGGAALVVFAGALSVLALAAFGRALAGVLGAAARRAGVDRWPPVTRALAFADRTAVALSSVRHPRVVIGALGLSLASWLVTFAWLYAFARAFGPALPFERFIVGATFASLSKAIPTPTLGGHGVSEAGWTLGMTLAGWPAPQAIATGLGVSALNLVAVGVFGLPALGWLEHRRRAAALTPNAADRPGGGRA